MSVKSALHEVLATRTLEFPKERCGYDPIEHRAHLREVMKSAADEGPALRNPLLSGRVHPSFRRTGHETLPACSCRGFRYARPRRPWVITGHRAAGPGGPRGAIQPESPATAARAAANAARGTACDDRGDARDLRGKGPEAKAGAGRGGAKAARRPAPAGRRRRTARELLTRSGMSVSMGASPIRRD